MNTKSLKPTNQNNQLSSQLVDVKIKYILFFQKKKNSPDSPRQQQQQQINEDECNNPLGHINQTMSDENLQTFKELEKFDVAQDNFCESDGS
jgi:hypothetical protein